MATTIAQAFRIFSQNLEISGLQESTVSTRQRNVRAAVAEELTVLDDFLTGSYRRSTLIAPLAKADVDVLVVLDPAYYAADGQAPLLDRVRRALLKTYTTPAISRNGQAVTIEFKDFHVDVVPAFNRSGGGYLIPDSTRSRWIETDPKAHVRLWAEANTAHSGDLVPLLKMLKCWNREHSAILTSFHLETLAFQALQGITISNAPSGCRYVFDKARASVAQLTADPAGYPGDVGGYLNTSSSISAATDRLATAYLRAVEAERLERAGNTRQAVEKWGVVFGDYFPAYG